MTSHLYLNDSLRKAVLEYLGCPLEAPTLRYLNRLIYAYTRKVPWESVSRIVKRHTTSSTSDCPRWPEEFWLNSIQEGFGGTCFESSLAFYALLISSGYTGYLTVNNMGTSHACHAAIVVWIRGRKYLVDVTIPVHSAVQFSPEKITRQRTSFHDYMIRPVRENVYEIERSHHPQRNVFTLIDIPISLPDFQVKVLKDYTESGFFLKSVVMSKVIDDKVWRFFSDREPSKLENFNRGGKRELLLQTETLPDLLAARFQMPADKIFAALTWINSPPSNRYSQQVMRPFSRARIVS
jgi:arylamine N-acetyltransferase